MSASSSTLKPFLAEIPGPALTYFDAALVPREYVGSLLLIDGIDRTRVPRFLIRVHIQYQGTLQFPLYIIKGGDLFTHWYYNDHVTIPIRNAVHAWFNKVKLKKQCLEAKARMALIKEELMAAAWAPARVAKLVAAGAWDLLE